MSFLSVVLERRGKSGLNLILGVSKGTIERNVLEPMRDFWGENLVDVSIAKTLQSCSANVSIA